MCKKEEAIFSRADRSSLEIARVRDAGGRLDSTCRYLGPGLLPPEEAIRRLAVGSGAGIKSTAGRKRATKKLVAELSLDKAILQDITAKKWPSPR